MTLKRNDFLDGSEGEDDGLIRDSDVGDDSRFKAFSAKRRKLDTTDREDDFNEDEDDQNSEEDGAPKGSDAEEGAVDHALPKSGKPSNPDLRPLTQAQLAASQLKAHKTGVIYISRIPPFMKPSTIRRLLSPHGSILRLFLTPEPSPAYSKRVKSGGNKKRSFIDGWVEFASKKRAKICAETLNGNIIGGKKGGWYHDDLWNMKYLRGFKWADLMEQVQGEERLREGRMRAELQREAKERKAFLSNLEVSKKERTMEAKRKKRREKEGEAREGPAGSGGANFEEGLSNKTQNSNPEMRFKQIEVNNKDKAKCAQGEAEYARSVLSKIF